MLLASNIGFLVLVGTAQIFYALFFDPQRGMQSNDEYKSFILQGYIYQCLINTYYAASFVFCFASSSMFRREIDKLLTRTRRKKSSTSEAGSLFENQSFIVNTRLSRLYPRPSSSFQPDFPPYERKRGTESIVETDVNL